MPRVSFETQLIDSTCEQSAKLAIIYREIAKISPGLIFFKGPFWRGLYSEELIYGGKFAFQNDWAGLIVGRKFTVLLCDFVFEGNFQVQAPGGLIFGGVI